MQLLGIHAQHGVKFPWIVFPLLFSSSDRARLALRKKKYQEQLFEKTEGQLMNLEEMVHRVTLLAWCPFFSFYLVGVLREEKHL